MTLFVNNPSNGIGRLMSNHWLMRSLLGCAVWFALLPGDRLLADKADHFIKQVVPIFQHRCLNCHNSLDRKGDFSLQTAKELLDSEYVAAGDVASSHLLEAITSQDGKRPSMPKNGTPLEPDEIAAIRAWIADGAFWPAGFRIEEPVVDNFNWWSLQPVRRSEIPPVLASHAQWVRTPIDAFILRQLAKRGLVHATEADRLTLIRRLNFDLIGLPPAPAEVHAFVNDTHPAAYERLVDRLLASPRYGERWARHWLDVVKYADTCGYDKDKLRPNAWPYRDYVIRSFNTDKNYARFVQEQIAGDVMFPNTADGILGLGFVAAGPWDFIGHVEVPESKIDGRIARHIDRDEMVTNTLNTFCSITIQCARCHNHKFDPFTQEHYYSLQSVFAAVDRADRLYDVDESVKRRRLELNDRLKTLQAEQRQLEDGILRDGGAELTKLDGLIRDLNSKSNPKAKRPEYGYHSLFSPNSATAKWVEVDLGREVEVTKIILRPCHDEFGGIGAGFGFPVRFRVAGRLSAEVLNAHVFADHTKSDVKNPLLFPFEIDAPATKARFIRVTATKLVERKNDYILALAEVQVLDGAGNNVALKAKVSALDSIEAPIRWTRKNLTDGIWAQGADPKVTAELATARKQREAIMTKVLTPDRIRRREALAKDVAGTQQQIATLPQGQMVYSAATHFQPQGGFQPTMGKPRLIHVLHRGNILQPRDEVQPGTVPLAPRDDWQFNLEKGHSEGERRVRLAEWITQREHPLTWRSIVNRVWQYHFGRGIVDSPNDLGRMGRQPTHPELLDWLASEFRDSGQSFKHLHRLIVLSAAYRQSSATHSANAKIDGGNQFLWRMNRRRLEAEEIRDSVLAVSGRMQQTMGGPGYYLFMLERTAHSPHYEYHKFDPADERSHRRSLYRFIVRSQPDPFMTTLDCADSSQSTPRRDETLTSLQALSLLNNRFNLTMASEFAKRLESEAGTAPEQVRRAFELVTGRFPSVDEHRDLVRYANQHGLANLCRVLFNLSEFVYAD
ncbi:MAG: DUF1553 domain-containing protein [Planctomycetota bacterium]|nr:DUF1553 domain-containing protein [Planctomycetota bacterium]